MDDDVNIEPRPPASTGVRFFGVVRGADLDVYERTRSGIAQVPYFLCRLGPLEFISP